MRGLGSSVLMIVLTGRVNLLQLMMLMLMLLLLVRIERLIFTGAVPSGGGLGRLCSMVATDLVAVQVPSIAAVVGTDVQAFTTCTCTTSMSAVLFNSHFSLVCGADDQPRRQLVTRMGTTRWPLSRASTRIFSLCKCNVGVLGRIGGSIIIIISASSATSSSIVH